MNISDIINNNTSAGSLTRHQCIEVINELIKLYKHQLNYHDDTNILNTQITNLNAELNRITQELNKSIEMNKHLNTVLFKPLTVKERLTGKIDLKFRTQK